MPPAGRGPVIDVDILLIDKMLRWKIRARIGPRRRPSPFSRAGRGAPDGAAGLAGDGILLFLEKNSRLNRGFTKKK
jgi:hypothetical protein